MNKFDRDDGVSRRKVLGCVTLSNTMRSALIAAGLGAVSAMVLASVVLPGWAQNASQASADSVSIANLRGATRAKGLSLGDRACLATGLRLGGPVITADRAWAAVNVGVTVQLIRH